VAKKDKVCEVSTGVHQWLGWWSQSHWNEVG
jgi:hypothetical protein